MSVYDLATYLCILSTDLRNSVVEHVGFWTGNPVPWDLLVRMFFFWGKDSLVIEKESRSTVIFSFFEKSIQSVAFPTGQLTIPSYVFVFLSYEVFVASHDTETTQTLFLRLSSSRMVFFPKIAGNVSSNRPCHHSPPSSSSAPLIRGPHLPVYRSACKRQPKRRSTNWLRWVEDRRIERGSLRPVGVLVGECDLPGGPTTVSVEGARLLYSCLFFYNLLFCLKLIWFVVKLDWTSCSNF